MSLTGRMTTSSVQSTRFLLNAAGTGGAVRTSRYKGTRDASSCQATPALPPDLFFAEGQSGSSDPSSPARGGARSDSGPRSGSQLSRHACFQPPSTRECCRDDRYSANQGLEPRFGDGAPKDCDICSSTKNRQGRGPGRRTHCPRAL